MRKIIGIIVADPFELHHLKEFQFVKLCENDVFCIEMFLFGKYDIYVCNSKIGITNAAITTQHLIDKYNVEEIWNYGAVGSSNNIKLHQVVIPQKFFYFDVTTPWYKRGQVPQEKPYFKNSILDCDSINLATGQSFVCSSEEVKLLKQQLDVDLFDMEACAIAQVCDRNQISFFCVKSVSDVIGYTDTKLVDINESISIASKKALDKMIQLLKERN